MDNSDFMNTDDMMRLNSYLELHDHIAAAHDRLMVERSATVEQIRSLGTSALRAMCTTGEYTLIERAAFSTMFDDGNIPKNVFEMIQKIKDVSKQLKAIDTVLSEQFAPILAFTIGHDQQQTQRSNEIVEYTCRLAGGAGLKIEERSLGNGGRYVHEVSISEEQHQNNSHVRHFGQVPVSDPIIYRRTPRRIVDWSAGPAQAAADLSEPPRKSLVTHLLFGRKEI